MSEIAKKLFDGIQAMKNGLQEGLKEAASQCAAEAGRQVTQGSMEIASVLFTGQGFVQYGPGQNTPTPDHQHDHDHGIER